MRQIPNLLKLGIMLPLMSACQIGGGFEPSVTTLVLPYEAKTASCTAYAFVDKTNKETNLGEARGDVLLVGFKPGITLETKQIILAQYPFFDQVDGEISLESGAVTKVVLHQAATCFEAEKMVKMLQKHEDVLFAAPAFNPKPSQADEYQWVGLSNEILVSIIGSESKKELANLLKETNTNLVASLSEELYLISTSKNSLGNALEVSNAFNKHSFVAAAEPNLIYSLRPTNGQEAGVQSVFSRLGKKK